jgi:hypothetical protein
MIIPMLHPMIASPVSPKHEKKESHNLEIDVYRLHNDRIQ